MFLGRQNAAPGCFHDVTTVSPPSDLQVRSAQGIEAKLRQKLRITLQLGMLENTREVRVRDDLLFNLVAAVRIGVHDAIGQRIRPGALHLRLEVALLFMEETLPIGDQILKVTNLGPVNCGVISFGDNAIPKSEPEATGGSVGGPYALLSSLRPSRLNTRPAKSNSIATKLCQRAPRRRFYKRSRFAISVLETPHTTLEFVLDHVGPEPLDHTGVIVTVRQVMVHVEKQWR